MKSFFRMVLLSIFIFIQVSYAHSAEMKINTYNPYTETNPHVASNSSDYLAVWHNYWHDGSGGGIYGQAFTTDGTKINNEFRINQYTTGEQQDPYISSDGTNYLVTWSDSANTIYGRILTSSNTSVNAHFQISTSTTGSRYSASASNSSSYLVTWQTNNDGSSSGVYGQFFDTSGSKLGSQFRVNTYYSNNQMSPSVASNGSDYLVTWESYGPDGDSWGIFGQKYGSDRSKIGTEFVINNYRNNAQMYSSVASNGSNYLVTWQSRYQDGSEYGIYGRIVGIDGILGDEFRINNLFINNNQTDPYVVSNGEGYLVVWESRGPDGSDNAVMGRYIDTYGTPDGDEFLINTHTPNEQQSPAIGSCLTNYFVVWESKYQDGNEYAVYGDIIGHREIATVPEPLSIILLTVALLGFIKRKK